MASLPFPLDFDFTFRGTYMMIEGAICEHFDLIFIRPYITME